MKMNTFQINTLPDLSLKKYQMLADTGIQGVLKRHESFLRQWHGICMESGSCFHLLYLYLPDEIAGKRLKVYFTVQSELLDLKTTSLLLKNSPLSDFYEFQESILPNQRFLSAATLTKKERIADIYNPMTGENKKVHYVPEWEMNEDARLYDLFRIMKAFGESGSTHTCAFRVDMYPVSMGSETRASFEPILKNLRGENEIKLVKETGSLRSDSYAKDICKEYENWITALETTPHFRTNIYGFAENLFEAKLLLNAAGAEALARGDFSIAAIKAETDGFIYLLSRMDKIPENYCFYPKEATLKSWSTTFCIQEAVPFFRLPVLYDGEVIELPKETAPQQINDGIYVGEDKNAYPVYISLKELSKHAFFTGMPGAGKTNTMLHLATELWRQDIPFLVLEPAKKEYRTLLGREEMQNICLFSPHLGSYFPLQLNPLEFPEGVQLSEHINALLEVFEGSFVLEGPTHKFLSSSIQQAYRNKGWDLEDVNGDDNKKEFPTLQDVYDTLNEEIEASSYDSELRGNMRAFLQVRLGSLMERDAGEVFNVPYSTIAPEDWLYISAIVELETLGEQAKNFFVLLLCHYIVETLRADPQGGVDSQGSKLPVRHAVFIEEAHNILADSSQQQGEGVSPKISATAYIVKMLAEVRALREAIFIADQLPTALAVEVTKNTGTKLVHRLTAQDDRELIGTAISASPLQLEQMASFSSGQAFIYHEKTLKPFEIQVAEWIKPNLSYDISDDRQLYRKLEDSEEIKPMIQIFWENWKRKSYGPAIRQMERWIKQCQNLKTEDKDQMRRYRIQKADLQQKCRHLLKKCESMEARWNLSKMETEMFAELNKIRKQISGFMDLLNTEDEWRN